MQVYDNVIDMIGGTALLRVNHLDTGPCTLYLKLENENPGGSIKDRIGLSMIEAAEAEGRIRPGGTIIEATAGNTGLGLALVAAQKGYRMLVIVPDKMSQEKIHHLKALGAEVMTTRSDVAKGHPDYYQDVARRIAGESENALWVNQFENEANPKAHYEGTGPEIWRQMDGRVDALVAGVGSGGTISGTGRYLKEQNPDLALVLADPVGSILADLANGRPQPELGSWLVEGIGEDFVPDILEMDLVDEGITVSDAEAFATARELLQKEGVLAGSSTGVLVAAALAWCRRQSTPKRVVTFVCDSGNKYLSKMFNDFWMSDQGFTERTRHGDLRDLIARRAWRDEVVAVRPDDSLMTAYGRMKLYDISQLPVLNEAGGIVGILDESDLLLALWQHGERFSEPVSAFMTDRLEIVPPDADLDRVMPILRADRVAIVVDARERFLGLITRIDLINHLRQQVNP